MSVLDTLTAAQSLSDGLAPGGQSFIALTDDRATQTGQLNEQRLREHIADAPGWIAQSEMFYIDTGMVPIVCSAGAVLPDNEPVHVYDPPSPYGFILVGGGATLCHLPNDGEYGPISSEVFTAMLWATFGGQIYIQRFERAPEGWYLLDVASIPIDGVIPPPARAKDRTYTRRLVIPGGKPDGTHTQVALTTGPETRDLIVTAEQRASDAATRWLVACWRLMGQTITELSEDRLTRQQRRQLERKNVPLKQVTIIRLRHCGQQGNGGTSVNWSHRWVVRGHWRQQPCKDENGEWTTRPVFIHPYIKGPEELPILNRSHVNYLVR